jgi:broad specificity phosphatase PhoE
LALFNVAAAQPAAEIEGRALVAALRDGGYNIYFRHAATDWSQNDQVTQAGDWDSCDPGRMRQLSEAGRQTAGAIGDAFRALQVPVGQVFASPYCRTIETARYMRLAERARRRLARRPPAGMNTVLAAHGNVLVTATGVYPQEAEAIVFRPADDGSYAFVARIAPGQWARLVAEYSDR